MSEPAVSIPATAQSPALHLHVNPLYCLYHFLAREAQLPPGQREPATAEAARLMAVVRQPLGVHGIWDKWEQPVTLSATPEEAERGLREVTAETVDLLGAALRQAEDAFRQTLWPQRLPLVEAALATLRQRFVPHFPALAARQADQLGLTWPAAVDAFLVTDCYDQRGAYGRPLTVDVVHNQGLELCETLLHEVSHVGDVQSSIAGKRAIKDRLLGALATQGLTGRAAWDVWHAVIFAASAAQVRAVIAAEHVDYALARGLYARFGVPDLPELWSACTSGKLAEAAFLAALAEQAIRRQ